MAVVNQENVEVRHIGGLKEEDETFEVDGNVYQRHFTKFLLEPGMSRSDRFSKILDDGYIIEEDKQYVLYVHLNFEVAPSKLKCSKPYLVAKIGANLFEDVEGVLEPAQVKV